MSYLPITRHGLIGDLHTAALVGSDGRIVWLPWPRFDAPSIFAALLDDTQGGEWLLAPRDVTASSQAYSDDTAVLITSFQTPSGRAELVERFEQLLGYCSAHGLLSEEVDPATGTALGNYPQAFSHIGLINSALALQRAE